MSSEFDVVRLPPTDHVEAGDEAPDFTRPLVGDEYWADASLSDLAADGPVVLVFHPMDGAFPATYVWQELQERRWADAYDVTVVGLSISTPYEHSRFVADRDLSSALFSDPGNAVAERYGIVNDLDGMAGIKEPRPAVYVVDADLAVRYAWVASEWPEFPDYDAVEAALSGL